jgi:hypothetical protein
MKKEEEEEEGKFGIGWKKRGAKMGGREGPLLLPH